MRDQVNNSAKRCHRVVRWDIPEKDTMFTIVRHDGVWNATATAAQRQNFYPFTPYSADESNFIFSSFCLQLMLHTHMQMHNDTTIKTQFLEKYTSHFIWKVCVWEGVGARTELQHIDPHSIGQNHVSFPFSWAAQPGAWGPTLLGAGFLYRILSPTGLVSKTNWLPVFTELFNSPTPPSSCGRHNSTHATHPRSRL